IRLRDASEFARVHVFATRYEPAFSAYAHLGRVRDAELQGVYPAHAESVYLSGRNIGDEYRYVLDRRYQKKYPGNLLERPALSLTPWGQRSPETGEQAVRAADDLAPKGEPAPSSPAADSAGGMNAGTGKVPGGDFADLDFLADTAAVITNRVPENGVVKIN